MSDFVITHCKHGLDLRVHPRCFLCKPYAFPETLLPGPPGCQCPPFWFGVTSPPCPVHNPQTGTTTATYRTSKPTTEVHP